MIQYCNYDIKGTLAVTGTSAFTGAATFAGNVMINGDGQLLKFTPTSYDDVELGVDSNGFVIYNTTDARYDLKISGTGNATFGGTVYIPSKLEHTGDSNTFLNFSDDTITLSAGANSTVFSGSGLVTFPGDITVSGGDITLGGTGRITGVDTVSAGTDATSKTYVDNAITTATGAYLPLAGGTMSGNIGMGNNNITGVNEIKANGDIKLNTSTGEHALYGAANAQTMLYHNGIKKFETASNGVSIIGNIDLTPGSSDISIIDNSGAALEVKQGSDLYMRFITTNGGEHIEVNKNMEIQGLTATAATFSSTVTVSNGQIVLNGTGRIQGIDTVSASTDAANKAYVDASIPSIPTVNNATITIEAGTNLTCVRKSNSSNNRTNW